MQALAEVSDYRVQLEIFEGPLDLLLYLIKQQEIDIYDIPISMITDQYLRYVQMMRDLSITVAGDFLVMAATLIYIKSKMLLPVDEHVEDGEEMEDPRRELVDRLLEHERFKKAADMLHDRQVVEESVWPRGEAEFEEEEQEAVSASVFDLVKSFHQIVERFKDKIVVQLEHDKVTVEGKMSELRRLLSVSREVLFSSFLATPISRLHLVVTIVALLELARLSEIRLLQDEAFADIRIVAC
jgi:segregation and condensation protein A